MGEANRNPNQSKKALWFANTIFVLGSVVSALLAFYSFQRFSEINLGPNLKPIQSIWVKYIIFFIISTALFSFGLRLKGALKIGLTKLLLAIAISAYSIEFYLELGAEKRVEAKKDFKSQFEMVKEFRQEGFDSDRDIGGARFIDTNGLETEEGRIFPLGGVSNNKTVMEINSLGFHPVIETDEHGYNNKKGLYNKNDVDIIIIGGCTMEYVGLDDPYEENLGEQLRKLNFKTINLSKQGTDPLIKLASLKEFAEHLMPKVVILPYGDDASSYVMRRAPFLHKYLNDKNFKQDLISRQAEVDGLLKEYLYQKWETKLNDKVKYTSVNYMNGLEIGLAGITQMPAFTKLHHLRNMLEIGAKTNPLPKDTKSISPDFVQVIKAIDQLVVSWGGRLYGINWPPIDRYKRMYKTTDPRPVPYPEPLIPQAISPEIFDQLKEVFSGGLINMTEEVFDAHSDPLSLFPKRKGRHLNGEANRMMAKAIAKRIQADGIMPRNN